MGDGLKNRKENESDNRYTKLYRIENIAVVSGEMVMVVVIVDEKIE